MRRPSPGVLVRHRSAIASTAVIAVALVSVIVYAIQTQGFTVHRTELNDGGVWLSNDFDGQVARNLVPIRQLDAAIRAGEPGGHVDVVQDGAFVLAVDSDAGTAVPVAVGSGTGVDKQKIRLPSAVELGAGGGSAAVLDVAKGELRAMSFDAQAGTTAVSDLDASSRPTSRVGADAQLAVATTGAVVTASQATRSVRVMQPVEGGFGKPETTELADGLTGPLDLTTVGDRPVVLGAQGNLQVGGDVVPLGQDAVPQQPGPTAGAVLVATAQKLIKVSLGDRTVTTVGEPAPSDAQAARPVRFGRCDYGAWSTSGEVVVVRGCDGDRATQARTDAKGAKLVFRVNRGQLLLNDTESGRAWEVESSTLTQVTDWPEFAKRVTTTKDDETEADQDSSATSPPKAVDDTLGGRPGRIAVLHVLDNDTSSRQDGVLTVVKVSDVSDRRAQVQVAPDRQSVLVGLPAGKTGDTTFKYTIDDGRSRSASAPATVVVHARGDGDDRGPVWWSPEAKNPSIVMSAGATTTFQVLQDWRDRYDGDPVNLDSVKVQGAEGTASVTPEGLVRFAAAPSGADRNARLSYTVSSGAVSPATRNLSVRIVGTDAARGVAARPQDDVVLVAEGGTATVRPLANDLPGADPTDPEAKPVLAGAVKAPGGLKVDSDTATGELRIGGDRKGTRFLSYRVRFGAAPVAVGHIRVDVVPKASAGKKPVTAPDFATVRGTAALTVDVLGNDYDPAGGLLAVQSAQVVGADGEAAPDDPVEVAVVDGRWLRVGFTASTTSERGGGPKTAVRVARVRYTASNGPGTATGLLTVTQRPPPADDSPVAVADEAVVRAGDSVLVPVLDNDSAPSGAPLGLLTRPAGAPAAGVLRAEVGQAYVSGRTVRFVAPAAADPDHPTARVEYGVVNTVTGELGTGTLTVRVIPAGGNRPPTQQTLEARVVAGDTVVVRLPAAGNDPDGDSVTVVGLDRAPTLGRVLGTTATSLTYQAFPGAQGTDSLRFRTVDPSGAAGTVTVRVAVVDAGRPQPPVAVDDPMWAAPGATVSVDASANDFRTPGTPLKVQALTDPPAGTTLDAKTQLVSVRAGAAGSQTSVPYTVSNGLAGSDATITVTAKEGYNNPPVAFDAFAAPAAGATDVTLDVLAKDYDPDGPFSALHVTSVTGKGSRFQPEGKVTVAVGDRPQVLTYVVEDGAGGAAAGAIYVPAGTAARPYLKPGASVQLKPGETRKLDIADYVVSPGGKPLSLTVESALGTAPSDLLDAGFAGKTSLKLTALDGRKGPGSVTFEVTTASSLADRRGVATINLPVQVGDPVPVLNCPATPVEVRVGAPAVVVDVASLCHVWTPDPAQAAKLTFTGAWASGGAIEAVDVESRPDGVAVAAGGTATPGDRGTLNISAQGKGVQGAGEALGRLTVVVVASPPPTFSSATVQTFAGKPVTVALAGRISSPFGANAHKAVVQPFPQAVHDVTVEVRGTDLVLTPTDPGYHGVVTFGVNVTDAEGSTAPGRTASGTVTVRVVAAPDPPVNLHRVGDVASHSVVLAWDPPQDTGGAVIDGYRVNYGGKTRECGLGCTLTGLENGEAYPITVEAHNAAGWGQPGGQIVETPDAKPGAVPMPTLVVPNGQRDGQITVTWAPAPGEGSQVTDYVFFPADAVVTKTMSTATLRTGGNDGPANFSIAAKNRLGQGVWTPFSYQSSGAPATPGKPTYTSTASADGRRVLVLGGFGVAAANGPGVPSYRVERAEAGGAYAPVCDWQEAVTCRDGDLVNDGRKYTYRVQARNQTEEVDPGFHASGWSPTTSLEAAATPDKIDITQLKATGENGTATVTFDVGRSYGAKNTVTCTITGGGACTGDWNFPTGGQDGVTRTLTGLPNGQAVTVTLQAHNGSTGGEGSGAEAGPPDSRAVTAYGPIGNPVVTATKDGASDRVNWNVSVDPNGRAATVRIKHGGATDTFTTGVGPWARGGTDTVGYDTTDTIEVTVTDDGRATTAGGASARTDPKPNPPQVIVSKGQACGDARAVRCSGGSCTAASCAYIHVETKNFGGAVSCTFNSQHGSGGFVQGRTWGANDSKDSPNWYGYPREWVSATCGGVTGQMTWS